MREIFLAQARGSVSLLPGYLVKMLIAFSALGLMQQWAGYVTEGVSDINNQLGVNPGNVLANYEQALATKFGGIINSSGSAATVPPAGLQYCQRRRDRRRSRNHALWLSRRSGRGL